MGQQRLAGSDGLPGRRFTLGQLQRVMFNNRNYGGELVRDDLVALCQANPFVQMADGADVDLRAACTALARWNLRDDLDSVGVHVFREFMLRKPSDWLTMPFDPEDPVNTPHTLNRSNPEVLRALGEAVRQLSDAGIAPDAPLGSIQSEPCGNERIPIHGGDEAEGIFNMTIAPFQGPAGYAKVIHGSSFVMATSFTDKEPVSQAILTYSQSTNPASPYFADQTRLYSAKRWVPMRFAERDILADPKLRDYSVASDPEHDG
jgi:acyl-homoserine-lactone acylase